MTFLSLPAIVAFVALVVVVVVVVELVLNINDTGILDAVDDYEDEVKEREIEKKKQKETDQKIKPLKPEDDINLQPPIDSDLDSLTSSAGQEWFTLQDLDDKSKSGGLDPIVFEGWNFKENDSYNCRPDNGASFDYDNDGHQEYFCYDIDGEIFVIDFDDDGEIRFGIEMLNFHRSVFEGITASQFLKNYPDICNQFDCYKWNDINDDWISQSIELKPYDIRIDYFTDYDYKEGEKCYYHTNDRCFYGKGKTIDGHLIYAVQPSYIQNIQ